MALTPLRALAPERERRPLVRRPAPASRVPEPRLADTATPAATPPRPAWLRPTERAPPPDMPGPETTPDARHDASEDATHDAVLDAQPGEQLDARQGGELDAAAADGLGAQHDGTLDAPLSDAGGGMPHAVLGAGPQPSSAATPGGLPAAAGMVAMVPQVPEPETGLITLPSTPLRLPPTVVPFEAPQRLDLRPERPPQERTPDLDRHLALFAEAASAAARLHADLLGLAAREAGAARDVESRHAALRQRDLDGALSVLDTELETARGTLAQAEADCMTEINAGARQARARIAGAARRAQGALSGKAAEVARDTGTDGTERRRADQIATGAEGRIAELRRVGGAAADALQGLSAAPATAWPEGGDAETSAKNEAIVERIGPRASEREGVMRRGTTGMVQNLTPTIDRLRTDITNAFAPFGQMATTLTRTAPAAVARARDAALDQLRGTVGSLTAAVAAGRARSEAGLIAQHDVVRRQMVETARRRAATERENTARAGGAAVEAATGLAASQPAALRGLVATLRPETRRPAPEFATLVVRSAEGLRDRLAESAANATPRIARSGAERRAAQENSAEEASAAVTASSTEQAERFLEAALQTSEALRTQVSEGIASLDGIARPVTQSMGGYLDPIRRTYATQLTALRTRITQLGTEVTTILNEGRGSSGGAEADASAPATPATPPPAPMEGGAPSARAFIERAQPVARAPKTETEVQSYAERVGTAVATDIDTRTASIRNGLSDWPGPNVEMVMTGLRGLTARRAAAVEARYGIQPGGDLRATIRWRFAVNFVTNETYFHNRDAALAALNGDVARSALEEMQAAANLWNDEARIDRVQRSLTPAQATALRGMDGAAAILDEIRDDLDGTDREVFEALREGTAEGVGRANAIRLAIEVDRARGERGYAAEDRAADAIAAAARNAGSDRISGASDLPDLESEAERTARREAAWRATVTGFASVRPLPRAPGAAGETGPPTLEQGQAALIAAATGERAYRVSVPDEATDGYRIETVREGTDPHHTRLITAIVRNGPDSVEARAASIVVERNRPGGRPDLTRLDAATHDIDLNPELGRNRPEALARRDRLYELIEEYSRDPNTAGPPRSPEAVRAELQAEFRGRFRPDDPARNYAAAMFADERTATDADRNAAAVAAFNYAIEGGGTRVDVLRRQFGRMTRAQVDAAVEAYNGAHRGGDSLYARLGLHGEGDWTSELSGEERQEIERASLGVPTNDLERAELAALTARQQINEAGLFGGILASREYGYLQDDYARLLNGMGVGRDSFDRRGRLIRARHPETRAIIPIGNFDASGNFTPPREGSREDFERAIGLARLSAESYTLATDRIANAVTTALVVAAAITTTALTGGAAASILIPVLVTAVAGLAGMGMSRLIKGGRYGHEEAARDLVMTIVQSATAGLGAAASRALIARATARAALSGARAGEAAMETAMVASGRTGAQATLTLGEEAVIGGASNAMNSMAGAMMDPAAFHGSAYGEEVGHAALRGFFSGVVGAAAMRPFAAAGSADAALIRRGGRALGQGLSGSASRATEIGYEHGRDRHRASTAETVSDILGAGAQGIVQGFGEAHAEDFARARAARAARAAPTHDAPEAAAEPAARPVPEAAPEPPTSLVAPHVAPEGPAPRAAVPAEGAAEGARPAAALAEAAPLPPAPRPVAAAGEGAAVRPITPAMPDAPTGSRPAPRSSSDDDPTLEMRRPAPAPDEEVTEVMKRPAPSPDEEVTAVMRRPAPSPDEEVIDLTPGGKWAEGLPFIETDRAVAARRYGEMILEDTAREVAVYFDRSTGDYLVVQGAQATVPTAWLGSGRLHLVAHYHPNRPGSRRAGLIARLPSGGDGDMEVMRFESAQVGGQPVRSRIHYLHEGRVGHTDFGHDPNSGTARYWVEIDNPVTSRRERHEFADIDAYADWAAHVTGLPRDSFLARSPPAPPGPATAGSDAPAPHMAPQPDAPGPAALHPGGAGDLVIPAPSAPAAKTRKPTPPPQLTDEATTARADEVARAARPLGRDNDIDISIRKRDDTILVSLPHPSDKVADRTHVRARIVIDPGADDGPPVRFERNPKGVTIEEARVTYVIRIRPDADPAEIGPGMAEGFARMQHAEEARIRAGQADLLPEGPSALAPGAPLDRPLTVSDRGRIAALCERMAHLEARERALQADQREAGLSPAEVVTRQAEIDSLRARARDAVREMGLAEDPAVLPRLARLLGDPGLDPRVAPLVTRGSDDISVGGSVGHLSELAKKRALERIRLIRRAVDDANVGAEPEIYFHDEAPPKPIRQPTDAERAAAAIHAQRERRAVVNDAVRRLDESSPQAASTARRLLDLAPEPLRAALAAEGPRGRRAAVAALRQALLDAGMPPARVQAELRALGGLWRDPAVTRAMAAAAEYRAYRDAVRMLPLPIRRWARDHPEIAILAHMDRAFLEHRWQRFLTKPKYAGLHGDPATFLGYLRAHEGSLLRPAIAEPEAARHLAALYDAFVLRGGPGGDRFGRGGHGPNDPGIDLVLVERTPPDRAPGTKVPVILGDDKSLRNADGSPVILSGEEAVSALVENLTHNLSVEAGQQRQALNAQERQGYPIDRDHSDAVTQMEAAARSLRSLDEQPLWANNPDRFSNPAYIREVSKILELEQMRLVITSELGNVGGLSEQLHLYGFILVK